MRVLVTGGAGFIGSHIGTRLLDAGHEVAVFDTLRTGRFQNVDDRAEYFSTAVQDMGPVFGVDLCVHAAASYADPGDWQEDVDTNVYGAHAVAHLGVPTVYFQTVLPPTSSYAISKIAGEQYLRLSGIPLTVFRLANIYGPRNLSGAIPAFYKRLTAGESCTVADATRDFVYIDDLVRYVHGKIDQQETGTFTVASGVERSIIDVHDSVSFVLGATAAPELVARGPDDIPSMDLTPSADFKATAPFEMGVAHACAWYFDNEIGATYTHLEIGRA